MSMRTIYLNGVCLAHSWLEKAKLEGKDEAIIQMHERLLQGAIDQYKAIFQSGKTEEEIMSHIKNLTF